MVAPTQGYGGGSLGSVVEVTEIESLADGETIIGDGAGAPAKVAAFTAWDGFLKHEYGGLEFNLSAVDEGDVPVGTGAGAMGLESGATLRTTLGLGTGDNPTFAGLTATGPILLPAGAVSAPALARAGDLDTGVFFVNSNEIRLAGGGSLSIAFVGAGLRIPLANAIVWSTVGVSDSLFLTRKADATLHLGDADAASPVAQTLGAQGSRGGTDTDVSGASLTIRSGIGTGAAAASSIPFQTPTVGGSGTTAQTMATRLEVKTAEVEATVPIKQSGANGQAATVQQATDEQTVTAGATFSFANLIPAGAFVLGVTIRVTTAITSGDGGTDFDIGDGSDVDKWGAAIAFAGNTTTDGSDFTAGAVQVYASATSVVLTCNAGTFSGTGVVRCTVHYVSFSPATS